MSNALTLGDTRVATAFRDVSLTVVSGESDRVGTDTLLRMTGSASATGAGSGGSAAGELDSVEQTVKKLLRTLEGAHDLSAALLTRPAWDGLTDEKLRTAYRHRFGTEIPVRGMAPVVLGS